MILKVNIHERVYPLEIPPSLLTQAADFFAKMDQDMAQGWQMSRDWIEQPDREQRCQIAADKLLTALEQQNQKLALLMAAYILRCMPDVQEVQIDVNGDMQETRFALAQSSLTSVD